MKLRCRLFGHKLLRYTTGGELCLRCSYIRPAPNWKYLPFDRSTLIDMEAEAAKRGIRR